jgi:hypothetical protein
MSVNQAAFDTSRSGDLKVAACGVLTGILTPLGQPLLDHFAIAPGNVRVALLALPFAILVSALVRSNTVNPLWAMLVAAVATMVAFVCAINATIWIDGQLPISDKLMRAMFAGLAGGFVGVAVMTLGISLLPAGPRKVTAWLPMLGVGTLAGALLAVDSALNLDPIWVLYPVWQAGVAVGLTMALRRADRS